MLERDTRTKMLDLNMENAGKQQQSATHNNQIKLSRSKQAQHQQDETEANTDLSDLQLNNSIINVIEQHMPIELFMETPPLTGDCSSTHSTNSMCSTGGISGDSELPNSNQQTSSNAAAVLALDASATTDTMTTDMNDDFNTNMDNDGERPLVLVIITDYDMQQ